MSTAHAHPAEDFLLADHGLRAVGQRFWNGFLFLNARPGGEIMADVPLSTLDNWPMVRLLTWQVWQTDLACNWKYFWENYSECLHCPGIHPELCDMVPVYGTGVMGAPEALSWTPDHPNVPGLRPGAESWTMSGLRCGPAFAG